MVAHDWLRTAFPNWLDRFSPGRHESVTSRSSCLLVQTTRRNVFVHCILDQSAPLLASDAARFVPLTHAGKAAQLIKVSLLLRWPVPMIDITIYHLKGPITDAFRFCLLSRGGIW